MYRLLANCRCLFHPGYSRASTKSHRRSGKSSSRPTVLLITYCAGTPPVLIPEWILKAGSFTAIPCPNSRGTRNSARLKSRGAPSSLPGGPRYGNGGQATGPQNGEATLDITSWTRVLIG